MGRKISDYNGGVIGVSGTYPYGQIKDNPGGTTIDVTSNGDIQQFFQRIAATAGIALNDLEDNADNGFQYVQAVNTMFSRADSGLAEAFGASGFVPVRMSGMAVTAGTPPTVNVREGYFYYNSKLYQFTGGSYNGGIPPSVAKPCLILSTTDALPTAKLAMVNVPITPDASKVPLENLVEWDASVGITALETSVALGAWVNLPNFGNWTAGATQPRYRKDGVGRVELQGQFKTTATAPSAFLGTLPSGYRPTQNVQFPVTAYNATSVSYYTTWLQVDTSGQISYLDNTHLPSAADWYVDLSTLKFTNS